MTAHQLILVMPAIQVFMTGLTDWQSQNNINHTDEIYCCQD